MGKIYKPPKDNDQSGQLSYNYGSLICNLRYIISIGGFLKIIEFVLLLFSWGLVANFQGVYTFTYTIFFLVGSSLCWLYTTIFFLMFLLSVNKFVGATWPYICLFFEACCSCLMLIVSSLLADFARRLLDESLNPGYCTKIVANTSCDNITAASIFGFVATAVFAIDAVIHYREYDHQFATHAHVDLV